MRLLRWLTLPRLIAAVTIVGVFAIAFRAPLDTDTYWHLRAGQWEVDHKALLATDVFSFTHAGQGWLNVHWLSQILLYTAYAALGDTGLALFTALLAAGGMGAIYRICQGDPIVRATCVLLGAAAAAVFWSARSQMVSFLLGAIVVYLLWLYQKRGIDRLWLIPIVMIPWANAHGGFAIGFVLLALALIGEGAQWVISALRHRTGPAEVETPPFPPAARIAVVSVASAAAVLINPFGVNTLLLPFRTVGIGVLRDYIQEWAAPDFHLTQMWPFGLMLILTLMLVGLSSRRLDLRDAVMVGGTLVSALLAARNVPTFALVAAPVLSMHLDSLLNDYHLRLNSKRAVVSAPLAALNWLLLILVAGGLIVKMVYEMDPLRLEQARKSIFPVAAVQYLEKSHPSRELFNSYNWGGYLIWNAPDYPVYVDGRTDLYDDQFIRDYLRTYTAQAGWNERLAQSGINTVLVESESPLASALNISPGWSKIYSDSVAAIYVRVTSASR